MNLHATKISALILWMCAPQSGFSPSFKSKIVCLIWCNKLLIYCLRLLLMVYLPCFMNFWFCNMYISGTGKGQWISIAKERKRCNEKVAKEHKAELSEYYARWFLYNISRLNFIIIIHINDIWCDDDLCLPAFCLTVRLNLQNCKIVLYVLYS